MAQEEDFVLYPWNPSKISLRLQRNIYKNMHTSNITLSHKILLTWLPWKEMSKQSYLDLSSKSHKSCVKALSLWELGPRTSWLTHLYEVHLHICICFGMYILTWETNNYLRIFVLYICFYAGPTKVKWKDKNLFYSKHGERSCGPRNQHFWFPD